MSNSSSSNSEAMMIDTIKNGILAAWGIAYIVLGSIGTILNFIVLTRGTRWAMSPSIPYLFASTIAAIPIMYVAILSRIGIGFQITPFYYIPIVCKMQIYIANVSISSIIWFMVGYCWDQYLSSSRNALTRARSSIRNSYRAILIITLCVSVAYAQVFYCFEGGLTMAAAPCAAKNTPCSITDTTLLFSIQFMVPPALIAYFLIHVHINFRRIQQRSRMQISVTAQQTQTQIPNKRKTDRTLLRILLVQVFVSLVFSLPTFVFRVYSNISATMPKSNVCRSTENLIFNISLLLFYFEKVCSFYVYTLASRHFRQILWQFMIEIYRRNVIVPQN